MPFETSLNNCSPISDKTPFCFASKKNDHLETDTNTWDAVLKHIPKSMVIWQPFYMNGKCGEYVRSKGYTVVHEEKDFFEWEPPHWDIIVDNPPYSIKKKVMERCSSFGKPFVLMLPLRTLTIKCIRSNFPTQLLFLYSKLHHFKNLDGEYPSGRARTKIGNNPIEPTWFFFNSKLMPKDLMMEDED